MILAVLLALIVGTWNGNWFPSGRAEHRATPEKEQKTITLAAQMISSALSKLDPQGTNDVVICLNEMRSAEVVTNLLAQISRSGLELAVITRYRRRDRFDQQQDAIITTMPIASKNWSTFKKAKYINETPPRGYSCASLVSNGGSVTTHVYSVHLKSEYGATSDYKRRLNRIKRTAAIEQILNIENSLRTKSSADVSRRVVIAGDINADKWNDYFSLDTVFEILEKAMFVNHLNLLPREKRDTKPSKRWGKSVLDYVFSKNIGEALEVHVEPTNGASDHNAVFVRF